MRVNVVKFPADMKNGDPHHENGHENVEQDRELDQNRLFQKQREPENVNAVFDHEVSQDLRQGLGTADDHEETAKYRRERGRDKKR